MPALPKRARQRKWISAGVFFAAKEARAKDPIHVKALSDSTLRRAERIDLQADILCMSGAGVGHLADALRDDSQIEDKGEIAMVIS